MVCREASLLKELKHANIVTLHDIIHTKTSLTFVFEFVNTDLSQYLENHPGGLCSRYTCPRTNLEASALGIPVPEPIWRPLLQVYLSQNLSGGLCSRYTRPRTYLEASAPGIPVPELIWRPLLQVYLSQNQSGGLCSRYLSQNQSGGLCSRYTCPRTYLEASASGCIPVPEPIWRPLLQVYLSQNQSGGLFSIYTCSKTNLEGSVQVYLFQNQSGGTWKTNPEASAPAQYLENHPGGPQLKRTQIRKWSGLFIAWTIVHSG
jgi:hypothetical protein